MVDPAHPVHSVLAFEAHMKQILTLGLLLVLTGCGGQPIFNTPPAVGTFGPANVSTSVPITPASKCQSRLIGRVTDANDRVIKDALVDIVSGSISARATSDENGQYGFAGLCAGAFRVSVTVPGQQTKSLADTVVVDGANMIKYDIPVR